MHPKCQGGVTIFFRRRSILSKSSPIQQRRRRHLGQHIGGLTHCPRRHRTFSRKKHPQNLPNLFQKILRLHGIAIQCRQGEGAWHARGRTQNLQQCGADLPQKPTPPSRQQLPQQVSPPEYALAHSQSRKPRLGQDQKGEQCPLRVALDHHAQKNPSSQASHQNQL